MATPSKRVPHRPGEAVVAGETTLMPIQWISPDPAQRHIAAVLEGVQVGGLRVDLQT